MPTKALYWYKANNGYAGNDSYDDTYNYIGISNNNNNINDSNNNNDDS